MYEQPDIIYSHQNKVESQKAVYIYTGNSVRHTASNRDIWISR